MSSLVEDQWETDPFDDGSSKLVGLKHANNLYSFNETFINDLQNIWKSSLSDSSHFGYTGSLHPSPFTETVSLSFSPFERTNVIELIKTDNKLYNKVTQVFSSLSQEVDYLYNECISRIIPSLSLFGIPIDKDEEDEFKQFKGNQNVFKYDNILIYDDYNNNNETEKVFHPPQDILDDIESFEGTAQIWLGRFWNFLISLSNYIHRCYSVLSNMIRQCSSLYHEQQRLYRQSYNNVHLSSFYQKIYKLLNILILLDHVIKKNDRFIPCWSMYKRMILTVRKDPSKYNFDEDNTWRFEKLMHELQGLIMSGMIYHKGIEQFDDSNYSIVRNNNIFKKELFIYIKSLVERIESNHQKNPTFIDPYDQDDIYMGSLSLFGLYIMIYKNDYSNSVKKLFKSLFDLHKTFPIINIYGLATFNPSSFLLKIINNNNVFMKLIRTSHLSNFHQNILLVNEKEMEQRVKVLSISTFKWISKFENEALIYQNRMSQPLVQKDLSDHNHYHPFFNESYISSLFHLIFQGIKLSSSSNHLIQTILSLHSKTKVPIKQSTIRLGFECFYIIQSIHLLFIKYDHIISSVIFKHYDFIKQNILHVLKDIQVKLSRTNLKEGQLDQLAASTLSIHMIHGPPTKLRNIIFNLAMHQIDLKSFIDRENDLLKIHKSILYYGMISEINDKFSKSFDTSYLYWYKDIIPVYFKYILNHPNEAYKLPYIFNTINQCMVQFKHVIHESNESFRRTFVNEIYSHFKDIILNPLCIEIEKDLRLHSHSNQSFNDPTRVNHLDPFKNGVIDMNPLLKLENLKLASIDICIKTYVTHYLDTSFYNVNTVALFDWNTYTEMRNIAKAKYDLDLKEVHLPGQSLEQGLDVLEIMRNIHIFVKNYNYNLNNQVFIEKMTLNKTISSINIQHIANSIRTHGTGIMNTTVNFTYQFLKQKFIIFSQFLFDDIIKSSLFREIRFFNDNKEELNNMYPYERAEKLIREIKNKAGVTRDGVSVFDKFRILITEIGNAMGYVRMIRSGGLLHTSNSVKFIPHLEDYDKFSDLLKASNSVISEETMAAANNLDSVIGTLMHHLDEGTDYFRMFISVFKKEFRSEANIHLKNFYIMVPALTVNFVDSMLISKEKLAKKGSKGGTFTDDGFAIGISYILKLLDLNEEFDSLHWFDTVFAKLNAEQIGVNEMKKKKEQQQITKLTQKKLNSLKTEYQLLRFAFTGSRVFFNE